MEQDLYEPVEPISEELHIKEEPISDTDDTPIPSTSKSESKIEKIQSSPKKPHLTSKSLTEKTKKKTKVTTKKASSARRYNCDMCSSTFPRLWNLERHISQGHEGTKDFECDYKGCKSVYKQKSSLQEHKRVVHEDKKPYRCEMMILLLHNLPIVQSFYKVY